MLSNTKVYLLAFGLLMKPNRMVQELYCYGWTPSEGKSSSSSYDYYVLKKRVHRNVGSQPTLLHIVVQILGDETPTCLASSAQFMALEAFHFPVADEVSFEMDKHVHTLFYLRRTIVGLLFCSRCEVV